MGAARLILQASFPPALSAKEYDGARTLKITGPSLPAWLAFHSFRIFGISSPWIGFK